LTHELVKRDDEAGRAEDGRAEDVMAEDGEDATA
jgi:hypothetical protein